jgi:ABC-type uncharacterized transport system ATPase component
MLVMNHELVEVMSMNQQQQVSLVFVDCKKCELYLIRKHNMVHLAYPFDPRSHHLYNEILDTNIHLIRNRALTMCKVQYQLYDILHYDHQLVAPE